MVPSAPGTQPATPDVALQASSISRRYGAVVALADASMTLRRGEVMGLVGDNGAGKSTFLKVLSGAVVPDGGEMVVGGSPVSFRRPSDALEAGIETVYQDLALVDTMSAVQNVYLGREELSKNPFLRLLNVVNDGGMRKRSREVLSELGVGIQSVNVSVKGMSGGQRQCLAIARALLWGRQIVILDEPTAALGVRESAQVLELIGRLRDHGVSVILVSHNMQQLVQVADRVTVMRLGRTIATRDVADVTPEGIVGLITGAVPADVATPEDTSSVVH
ncbi:ATP-binding cassette domain-containing protein [Herbiconiux flava]|jgi:ABC-type sugar transport system ATPase subunit|uniref:ABC-type sugar transport system ATPase subunit n=1 Tax=Herbiconiux flava TaxID=881268 RepID=A0A852SJ04_9MICO|nr:ATP-binding cassette domain-containing protein [Herbiconiux flava]NYD69834.1 ABC-type sugar transport system ATPase subunit [Herbiconiux flava]GLK16583.1 sugar ABC transporter ATP-binding protein [Herbiconiux flava]